MLLKASQCRALALVFLHRERVPGRVDEPGQFRQDVDVSTRIGILGLRAGWSKAGWSRFGFAS